MTWGLIAVAAVGLLIGARFRVPALIAATLLTIIAGSSLLRLLDFSGGSILVSTIWLVIALQAAYLLGVAVTTLRRFM